MILFTNPELTDQGDDLIHRWQHSDDAFCVFHAPAIFLVAVVNGARNVAFLVDRWRSQVQEDDSRLADVALTHSGSTSGVTARTMPATIADFIVLPNN